MNDCLVFCRAGDESLHRHWLAPKDQRIYDVFIEYFGDQPQRFAKDGEYYSSHKGKHKLYRFAVLYQQNPSLFLRYKAIWIVDDDILADVRTVNRMFRLFKENRLWLAQPALTANSYHSHGITLQDPRYSWRYTNYVEVMAPVFSQYALKTCLRTFNDGEYTWGLDFAWVKLLGDPKDKIAILDETPVEHTRPVGHGSLYKGKTLDPWEELYSLSAKYGVEHPYPFIVHEGVKRRRIVSVSMVKNEADIIESFVRYHLLFLDHMVILDNGSQDGTFEILQKLKEEGLQLTLETDDSSSYDQPRIMTRLMRQAAKELGCDIVVPLDADEFLTGQDGANPRSVLEQLPLDRVYYVQWRTYLPHPSDNPGETFIPARMPYARPDQYETFFNVIVPSRLVLEHRLGLTLGNHDVTPSDKVNKEVLQTMRLAHYPIRSMEQLKSKVMVGWINHLSRHDRSPDEAWHWKRIVDAFAAGQIRNGEDLTRLAKAYTSHLLDPQRLAAEIEIRKMPLQLPPDYPPIVLKYTDAITVYADRNIVRNAEKLAKEYSALKRVYVHCGVPFVPDALSYYYLVSRHSGKVLAVQSAEEGAPAVQQTNRGEKGQQWKFVGIGEGYVLIANRLSGLVLDVSGESPKRHSMAVHRQSQSAVVHRHGRRRGLQPDQPSQSEISRCIRPIDGGGRARHPMACARPGQSAMVHGPG